MGIRRLTVSRRLRRESPELIRESLLEAGEASERVDELMEPLPARQLTRSERVVQAFVVLGWGVAVAVALVNFAYSFVDGQMIRFLLSLVISVAFFHHTRRLNGRAYGPGAAWLILVLGMSFVELSAFTPEERADPYIMGFVWGVTVVIGLATVGQAYLKAFLFPHLPWFGVNPRRPGTDATNAHYEGFG